MSYVNQNEQQEIDWVEERDGSLFGCEFKCAYPGASFEIINVNNFNEWFK